MTIDDAVIQNKQVIIKACSVSESVEHFLKAVLTKILYHHQCDTLLIPIYTAAKELLVNAVKANQKYIYFEGRKSYESIFFDSEKALTLFKLEMTRTDARHLDAIARKHNLFVFTTISMRGKNLYIDVENPTPMSEVEHQAVMQKLTIAQNCDDITDYFIQAQENDYKEGAGLGLVLITMMLKGMGLTSAHFVIDSNFEKTVASIMIPLTQATLNNYHDRISDTTEKTA